MRFDSPGPTARGVGPKPPSRPAPPREPPFPPDPEAPRPPPPGVPPPSRRPLFPPDPEAPRRPEPAPDRDDDAPPGSAASHERHRARHRRVRPPRARRPAGGGNPMADVARALANPQVGDLLTALSTE